MNMNLDPFDPVTLVRGTIATVILFAGIAFFTRAKPKRILGVLAGSLLLIPMVMFYDTVATRLGLWDYPSVPGGAPGPFAWYLSAAFFYGGGLGLIGWRLIRRFGTPGLIGFLIGFALFGATRDYIFSHTMGGIEFGPGPTPFLADLFSYGSPAAVVQLVMYWIAGPADSDPLTRTPRSEVKLSLRS
jgi:hypothetical protein